MKKLVLRWGIDVMSRYEPIGTGVEVNGQTILSVVNAFPTGLEEKGLEILAEQGIENPEEDSWYSQAAWLEAFSVMYDEFGETVLKKIGKEIPRKAEWPPGTDTVAGAIESIDDAYQINHRGGKIGNYTTKKIDDTTLKVICDNPYPCKFDTGIIESATREFSDTSIRLRETGDRCREDGSSQCVYEASW
jgi:predicted hydrocarbon binding protein